MVGVFTLLGGGCSAAYGQERGDTTQVDTLRQENVVPPPAPPDSVRTEDVAATDTSEPGRTIVNADSLSAIERDGERLQELFENVNVRQDTTRLQSEYGLRSLDRDEILFAGDVVIFERGDTLRADTVWYNRRTKVGRARSNVRLTDGEVVVRAPRATYYTDEKRSVFPDSVTLIDSSQVLRAREGTYWSDERRAAFRGNVQLTDPESVLEADSLTYFRDEERSIATGRVFSKRVEGGEDAAADTSSITYLFGEWADNQEQNRYSRVERQALLVRVEMDSTGVPEDTLAVRAHQLEAYREDTHHRLVAVDSVRIWQADLAAVADSAVYDRVVDVGEADSMAEPSPLPDTATAPPPDSVVAGRSRLDSLVARAVPVGIEGPDTLGAPPARPDPRDRQPDSARTSVSRTAAPSPDTTQERATQARANPDSTSVRDSTAAAGSRSGSRWGRPTAASEEDLPLEETRLFRNPVTWFERSQVWGDSIRVRARKRSLDTVFVRGAAFAAQQDTTLDRIRQLKGENITAFFRRDSLRQILARPNGEAIHFSASEDGTLNGATRASADYASLFFAGGEVERIKFGSGVQGEAYHKAEHIPDPFQLDGFQWTPERRPTRSTLLREERVRERLELPPPERSSPEPEPPVARRPNGSGTQPPDAAERRNGTRATSTRPSRRENPQRRPSVPSDSVALPPDSLRTKPRPDSATSTSDSTERSNLQP